MKYSSIHISTSPFPYPFGLTMQGISSSAVAFGSPGNKMKYNGKEEQRKEFSDGSGLEWMDFGSRMYDNQIGRWMVMDSKSEKHFNWTPFNYVANNPTKLIDLDGNDWVDANGNLKYKDGKYTQYASRNDIRMANELRKTKTGQEQFDKLIAPGKKIQVNINKEEQDVPKGKYHPGHTDTEVSVETEKPSGKKTVSVKSAVITIYEKEVDRLASDGQKQGSDVDFFDVLAATLGHEIEHTTNENATVDENGGNKEEKPTKIADKIIDERIDLKREEAKKKKNN